MANKRRGRPPGRRPDAIQGDHVENPPIENAGSQMAPPPQQPEAPRVTPQVNMGVQNMVNAPAGFSPEMLATVQQIIHQTVQAVIPLVHPVVPNTLVPPNPPIPDAGIPPSASDPSKIAMAFEKLRPPAYEGIGDPVEVEHWINQMEKYFDRIQCPDDQKVRNASFYLTKEAGEWWISEKPVKGVMSWNEFKDRLRARFYPTTLQRQKFIEFLHPPPEGMPVFQAISKFHQLLRYASSAVRSEKDKMFYFEPWIPPKVRTYMSGYECNTLVEYQNKAIEVERKFEAERSLSQVHKKQKFQPSSFGAKEDISKTSPYPSRSDQTSGTQNFQKNGKVPPPEYRCHGCDSNQHFREQCPHKNKVCFKCGGKGHISNHCKKERTNPSQTQTSVVGPKGASQYNHPSPSVSQQHLRQASTQPQPSVGGSGTKRTSV